MSTNVQSCGVNEGLQSCQGHLAARCQAGSDLFLFAALGDRSGVRVANDEPDNDSSFGSGGEHLAESRDAVKQECAAVDEDVDLLDSAVE